MQSDNLKPSIFRNSIWNSLSFIVTTALLIVATPIYINSLGVEQFGIFLLIVAIVSPLNILSAGIAPATIKYIAEYENSGDYDKCVKLVSTTLFFNIVIGLVGIIICYASATWLAVDVFNIDQKFQEEAVRTFQLAGWLWLVTQISGTFQGVIEGLQDYQRVSIGTIIQQAASNLFGIGLLLIYPRLTALVLMNVMLGVLFIAYWYIAAKKKIRNIRLIPKLDKDSVRRTLSFSFWQFVASFFGLVAGNADRFLIGAWLNTTTLGVYGVANRAQNMARNIPYRVTKTLFPATSATCNIEGQSEKMILDYGWRITALSGWIYACIFVLGPEFLRYWVGNEIGIQAGPVLMVLMIVVGIEFPSVVLVQYILGIGKSKWDAVNSLASNSITLLGMLLLIKPFGMLGCAWSGAIGLLLTRPIFHYWVYRKCFSNVFLVTDFFKLTYGILLSVTLGGAAGYASCEGLMHTFGRGTGYFVSIVVSPIVIAFVFTASERYIMGNGTRIDDLVQGIRQKALAACSLLKMSS